MLTNFLRFNGNVEKIEKMLIIQTLRNLVTFALKHATKLLKLFIIQKKKNWSVYFASIVNRFMKAVDVVFLNV
jgi:hypothetical protein